MEPQPSPFQAQPPQYQPQPAVPRIEEHEADGIIMPTQPITSSWQQPSAPVFNPEPAVAPPPPPDSFAPSAPPASGLGDSTDPLRPIAVVRVLSPVGVEYVFLTFTLFTGAIGLAAALLSLVNGKADFSVLAFPTATLVVSVPVFAYLFLRLKKMELLQPNLRFDPSKRRSTQFTQIVSFVVCLFTMIGLVFAIFASIGGQSSVPVGKALLDALCVLVVAGGILAYYWRDEHKAR